MINIKNLLIAITISILLTSCSAIDKQIKHGKLDVQTKMSETIFLDPVEDSKKTILLQIRNTSDKTDINILDPIKAAIEKKGYIIVTDPKKAHYMLQANILQVGKSTEQNPFDSLHSGFGGALAGGLAGAAITNDNTGAGVGVLAGGLIGVIADSAVQIINYRMITDLQLSERSNNNVLTKNAAIRLNNNNAETSTWSEESIWKKHKTRIISVATKTNLKFELALPELKAGLVQSISGLL